MPGWKLHLTKYIQGFVCGKTLLFLHSTSSTGFFLSSRGSESKARLSIPSAAFFAAASAFWNLKARNAKRTMSTTIRTPNMKNSLAWYGNEKSYIYLFLSHIHTHIPSFVCAFYLVNALWTATNSNSDSKLASASLFFFLSHFLSPPAPPPPSPSYFA